MLCAENTKLTGCGRSGTVEKKLCDELPTDQEHKLGGRADQAYRVQLTARSISFGGALCFQFFLSWVNVRKEAFGCSSTKAAFFVSFKGAFIAVFCADIVFAQLALVL